MSLFLPYFALFWIRVFINSVKSIAYNFMKKPKSDNSGSESLKIQYLSIDELVPYARNPRTHSEEQISQIAASIREFGFTNPILIDADQGIIAGHGRLAAAKELGLETIRSIGKRYGRLHQLINSAGEA
jgi:hypothetical protein